MAVNAPPELLLLRMSSSLCQQANAVFTACGRGCGLSCGQTFWHFPQWTHLDGSMTGRRKPSSSEIMEIAPFPHALKHAAHPVQLTESQMAIASFRGLGCLLHLIV
jgi:hypothetical protein